MNHHQSKVSCIMVTQRSRQSFARRAIEAFRAQTYEPRELVIVSVDSLTSIDDRPVSGRSDTAIVIVMATLPSPWPWTVGEMRNMAVARASGDFIATWDDDDIHHPDRLARQMDALLTSSKPACALRQMTIAWPVRNRYGITMASNKTGWEPTLITRRSRLGIYPAQQRGEALLTAVMLDVLLLNAPELYTYVIHGANTHDEAHFETLWSFAMDRRFEPESEESHVLAEKVKI